MFYHSINSSFSLSIRTTVISLYDLDHPFDHHLSYPYHPFDHPFGSRSFFGFFGLIIILESQLNRLLRLRLLQELILALSLMGQRLIIVQRMLQFDR